MFIFPHRTLVVPECSSFRCGINRSPLSARIWPLRGLAPAPAGSAAGGPTIYSSRQDLTSERLGPPGVRRWEKMNDSIPAGKTRVYAVWEFPDNVELHPHDLMHALR